MNMDALQRMRFRRSPERRISDGSWTDNRRSNDRRKINIRWIPLFRDTDEFAVQEILCDCEVLLIPAGTPLLKPGESNHNVYIPLSGEITAHLDDNLSSGGAIRIFPGECLGELSAIDGKTVSALVLALTDVRVLKLSRDVFWHRLMMLPGVAVNLILTLTERMRRANEQALQVQHERLELIHLRKELDVARQLQISMLPLQRPMFPERTDIEVCGLMEPASQVGGDLFDAFFVDGRNLFFCIGDVSGHGIAAALFMARTIGLLRILAMNTLQPDYLLELLNDRLCVGNEASIFVTLFCGFLDVETGMLRYSNGGHCPPILSNSQKTDLLAIPKGALIGAFTGMKYRSMELELSLEDILFCYTDGVTEAQDRNGAEFTEDRAQAIVNQTRLQSLTTVLDTLRQEVARFTGSDLLQDDCTMFAIRRFATSQTSPILPGV